MDMKETSVFRKARDIRKEELKRAVAYIISTLGYTKTKESALAHLTDVAERMLKSLGRVAVLYANHAGRNNPNFDDVKAAIRYLGTQSSESGLKRYWNGLKIFLAQVGNDLLMNKTVPIFPTTPCMQTAKIIRKGTMSMRRPSHIPDYLPEFPLPHTYMRTPAHQEIQIYDYEHLRDRIATKKRQSEDNLIRLILKRSETQSLFEPHNLLLFPVIAPARAPQPYQLALTPPEDENLSEEDSSQRKVDSVYLNEPKTEASETNTGFITSLSVNGAPYSISSMAYVSGSMNCDIGTNGTLWNYVNVLGDEIKSYYEQYTNLKRQQPKRPKQKKSDKKKRDKSKKCHLSRSMKTPKPSSLSTPQLPQPIPFSTNSCYLQAWNKLESMENQNEIDETNRVEEPMEIEEIQNNQNPEEYENEMDVICIDDFEGSDKENNSKMPYESI